MAVVSTETVEFSSDGFTIKAFLARPVVAATAGLPAVVIAHEWWGLTEHVKGVTRRFAQEGYAALAPDLYSRLGYKVTANAQEAASLMESLSSQAALRDLSAALQYLKQQPFIDPQRIGAVGFSMGGTFVLTQATHNSDLKAAVPFYGKVPPVESLARLLCPILYHYGAQDGWVTKQEIEQLRQGLSRHGKPGEVLVYPNAPHAFFNDTRPEAYRKEDAEAAWRRTIRFLGTYTR